MCGGGGGVVVYLVLYYLGRGPQEVFRHLVNIALETYVLDGKLDLVILKHGTLGEVLQ